MRPSKCNKITHSIISVNNITLHYNGSWSCRFIWCLAEGYTNGDQRRPMSFGSGRNLYFFTYYSEKEDGETEELSRTSGDERSSSVERQQS